MGKYPVSFYMDMFSGEIQAIIQSKNTLEQGCNIQAGLLCVKQQSPQTCTCTALAEHTGQEIRISSFNTSLLVNYIVAQDCPFIGFLFYLFIYSYEDVEKYRKFIYSGVIFCQLTKHMANQVANTPITSESQ